MKKTILFLMTMLVLFTGCKDYDDDIAAIEDRLDKIEGTSLATIDQQIAAINGSLDDLKAVDAALQKLIDDLEAEAADLQQQLDKNAAADAATKKALEDEIAAIKTLVSALQEKEAELEQRYFDLEQYINDEIQYSEEWASFTFATLEQYENLQMWIEAIKVSIKNLNDWCSETDHLLAMKFGDIEEAIAATETSMKEWVNKTLADGYYDIATIDAKLKAIKALISYYDDTELRKLIADQQAALEDAKEVLTAAYEDAIEDAVANDGVIDKAIAAAVKAAQDALQTEIVSIKTILADLEKNFANRIQSLTYIPTHTDGKATMTCNSTSGKWEAELSFFVTPKSVVGNIKQEHLSAKGVYTASTRAVDLIDMSVTAFESDATNGTITVTVSGNNLTNFLSGTSDAAVFLIISDGNSEFVSDYVPLTIEQTYTYDQASNTYTVYTAKGLYAWNKALETDLTTNLVLAADITLPNKDLATGEEITETDNIPSGSNWNPYGYYDSSVSDYTMYNGTIDGGGHTISGMRINMDDRTGFVKVLGGSGSIRNLLIDDVVIYSTGSYVAAFAGTNYGGIIENCHVKGEASSIYGQAYYVGGIVGYMNNKSGDAKIIACSNMATVTPVNYESSKYGGIVGIVSYMGSSYKLNVIGCWTKDTNENDRAKDGIGMNDGASVSGVFSFADATAANSKIVEMNQALEDAGYSYRWEAKSGGWPEIKKYGE